MTQTEKIPVIAIVGPTASGKSHLAVELAKWLDSEIVSADSMQIYKELSIGTAKPTKEDMDGIPHHMIDFLPMTEQFSVADYVTMARVCLQKIYSCGKIPILCGGTGLYVRSLLQNLDFSEGGQDQTLRQSLRQKAERYGNAVLVEELQQFDSESAARIDPSNLPRLIRAIEVYRTTGKTMTQVNAESRQTPSPYQVCMLGLNYHDRAVLYDRINRRVDKMMQNGLLTEAKTVLRQKGGQTALQAIGYKELQPYLEGKIPLQAAVENMKQGTRRYAKRQLTWFRREENIHWLYPDGGEDLVLSAKRQICQSFAERGLPE